MKKIQFVAIFCMVIAIFLQVTFGQKGIITPPALIFFIIAILAGIGAFIAKD